jgi:yecA family protein
MLDTDLTDAEFDELDQFLISDKTPADCMDISMLDGFLTALLIGPNTLLPSRWLPEVWGESPDSEMQFESETQAQHILDLIMRFYNDRARDLAEGVDLYDPAIYTREDDGKTVPIIDEWCTGFMRGVMLDAQAMGPAIPIRRRCRAADADDPLRHRIRHAAAGGKPGAQGAPPEHRRCHRRLRHRHPRPLAAVPQDRLDLPAQR